MFKPGDIICSDRFYNGKCVIVEDFKHYTTAYKCEDLFIEAQWWYAYKRDNMRGAEYDWRIATDDDVVKYLSRFVKTNYKLGVTDITVLDEGMWIGQMYMNANELADLSKIISKYVGVK